MRKDIGEETDEETNGSTRGDEKDSEDDAVPGHRRGRGIFGFIPIRDSGVIVSASSLFASLEALQFASRGQAVPLAADADASVTVILKHPVRKHDKPQTVVVEFSIQNTTKPVLQDDDNVTLTTLLTFEKGVQSQTFLIHTLGRPSETTKALVTITASAIDPDYPPTDPRHKHPGDPGLAEVYHN